MKYEYITDNSIKNALKYGEDKNDNINLNTDNEKLLKKLKKQLINIRTSNYEYLYKSCYLLTLKNGNIYVLDVFNDLLNDKKEEYKNNYENLSEEIKMYYLALYYCISKNNIDFKEFKNMVIVKINN